jgi:predicted 3-demethylubiquinone-9 3-methyltransferase (glyoxalase superfamily)
MPSITPFLWFDTQAQEAAEYYTSVFPNSEITEVTHYGEANPGKEGTVMTVAFKLDGTPFIALNGGPHFTFNEAVSFEIECASQEEVDFYWARLTEGGEDGPCGWLKDRFGLSWQVVPRRLNELITDPDEGVAQRAMAAMLGMRKIDIATLEEAAKAAA